MKRCGKSAPRIRQRKRHGKPHREQNRIGTATRKVRFAKAITPQGDVRLAVRVGCSRPCANMAPEEWPSRTIRKNGALQNPAYRLADDLVNEGFGVTRRTPRHFRRPTVARMERSAIREPPQLTRSTSSGSRIALRSIRATRFRAIPQSRPASPIACASRAGLLKNISWLPSHSTRRNSPSRSDNRGCHGMLCGRAMSCRQLT